MDQSVCGVCWLNRRKSMFSTLVWIWIIQEYSSGCSKFTYKVWVSVIVGCFGTNLLFRNYRFISIAESLCSLVWAKLEKYTFYNWSEMELFHECWRGGDTADQKSNLSHCTSCKQAFLLKVKWRHVSNVAEVTLATLPASAVLVCSLVLMTTPILTGHDFASVILLARRYDSRFSVFPANLSLTSLVFSARFDFASL